MPLDLENYVGREQAYVKHYFLAGYLERLIFKIASAYGEVVYIDGFSGPWQDRDERFQDTSFGIALQALTLAKRTWSNMNNPAQRREVRVTAHLVERDPAAYARLAELQTMFPDVQIVTHSGDFAEIAGSIAQTLPPRAFAFVLIDPKGWSVDLNAVAPLIGRENCEVVFNFMFDFINRFALSEDPVISAQLDRLIVGRDWRARLRAIDRDAGLDKQSASEARKAALVDEFKSALAEVGRYSYVADVDVLRPTKDRTLYFLVYGTRRPPGIEVFRDCHVSSLKAQSEVRGRRKLENHEKRSGQLELLASAHEMGPDRATISLKGELARASDMLTSLPPERGPGIRWDAIWPIVLSQCVVRLTDLKKLANEHRKARRLTFPNWPGEAKRTPENGFLVHRAPSPSDHGRLI